MVEAPPNREGDRSLDTRISALARNLLDERYARGEIDRQEYLQPVEDPSR
jgi:uncharacterized membrane protein